MTGSSYMRTFLRRVFLSSSLAILLGAAASPARAALINLEVASPYLDYNSYGFTPSPGTRSTVQSFGAFGSANQNVFDNRDSQVLLGFSTSGTGGIPTGRSLSDYQIVSVTLELTITHAGKIYDGTYDPISTYGANGEQINGDDAGRPMELYGVGFRNGITQTSFSESTPYSASTQPAAGTRSAYATDFFLGASLNGAVRDVSNNLGGLSSVTPFDPKPFAIGQVAASELTGGFINTDATVTFSLDLANPDVVRYIQLSLQAGQILFAETSLEQASQGGATTYSRFYSKENLAGVDPRLVISVQVVPEPAGSALLLAGFAAITSSCRIRRYTQA